MATGKKADTSRGFSVWRPGHLVRLSKEISLLLLGPHISHVVLVMLEAHLRDSGAFTNSTSLKETKDNEHPTSNIQWLYANLSWYLVTKEQNVIYNIIFFTLYSPIQSQELREKLGAILNLAVASAMQFHSSSTIMVTNGTSTLYGNYTQQEYNNKDVLRTIQVLCQYLKM